MSLVYNFNLDIFKDVNKNMSNAELVEFLQKTYETHKTDYKNEYLQSIDSIIYLYTGIYLYEKIKSGDNKLPTPHQSDGLGNKEKTTNAANGREEQTNQNTVAEEEDTIEPVKTGLTTDEEYEKLLGYE